MKLAQDGTCHCRSQSGSYWNRKAGDPRAEPHLDPDDRTARYAQYQRPKGSQMPCAGETDCFAAVTLSRTE